MKNDSRNKFLDTNILVFATFGDYDESREARRFVLEVLRNDEPTYISTQVLGEYFAVITGARFKDAIPLSRAAKFVDYLIASPYVRTLSVTADITDAAAKLCVANGLRGQKYYDAVIVATMVAHNIDTIITANERDFVRFAGIRVINPFRK